MTLATITTELEAADSLFDLARQLGVHCLDHGAELGVMLGQQASSQIQLEAIIARVKPIAASDWENAIADPTRFATIAGPELMATLEIARWRQPLDFLGVLLGLCQGALDETFRTFTGKLELDRGMPLPNATRPVPVGVEWMTLPATQAEGGLLGPLPWTLFGYSRTEGLPVDLDYSRRERIDELTWTAGERLPLIATVHPELGDPDFEITGPNKFFDVQPAGPDPALLLTGLATAGDAAIGLLPELCLARADELEDALAGEPDRYPPLVVAGSAHVREGSGAAAIRANESRLYLDGEHIATYRKHHPFRTKTLGGKTYPDPLYEDLSAETKPLTVLAATHTRLAVVICADLIDAGLIDRLIGAGVNLLLAPAMTPKAGSFESTVERVSGRWQGVTAIANVRFRADGLPFLCIFGTPRAQREERVDKFSMSSAEATPTIPVFDANAPLPAGVEWR